MPSSSFHMLVSIWNHTPLVVAAPRTVPLGGMLPTSFGKLRMPWQGRRRNYDLRYVLVEMMLDLL
jgi:hypothetical protein